MLLKIVLLLLTSAVLMAIVVCVACTLIYLDCPLWPSLLVMGIAGIVVVIAQTSAAMFIEERF